MSGQPAMPTDQPRPDYSEPGPALEKRAATACRRAWLSLLLYPVSIVGAFAVGEGLVSLYGYPSGGDEAVPFWVVLAAGVPSLLVFAVPGVLAVHFGRRAMRLGRRDAKTPAVIGAVLLVAFVAQNVLAYLAGSVFG